jgi:hypothetical protein
MRDKARAERMVEDRSWEERGGRLMLMGMMLGCVVLSGFVVGHRLLSRSRCGCGRRMRRVRIGRAEGGRRAEVESSLFGFIHEPDRSRLFVLVRLLLNFTRSDGWMGRDRVVLHRLLFLDDGRRPRQEERLFLRSGQERIRRITRPIAPFTPSQPTTSPLIAKLVCSGVLFVKIPLSRSLFDPTSPAAKAADVPTGLLVCLCRPFVRWETFPPFAFSPFFRLCSFLDEARTFLDGLVVGKRRMASRRKRRLRRLRRTGSGRSGSRCESGCRRRSRPKLQMKRRGRSRNRQVVDPVVKVLVLERSGHLLMLMLGEQPTRGPMSS